MNTTIILRRLRRHPLAPLTCLTLGLPPADAVELWTIDRGTHFAIFDDGTNRSEFTD